MKALLAEVEVALEKVTNWERCGDPAPTARAFQGDADGWHFLVVDFTVHLDGHPYAEADGTAVKGGVVVRLTRELARRGVALWAGFEALRRRDQ